MSEVNAKEIIHEAVKEFIRQHNKQPTAVKVSYDIACNLMKLGHNEIGDMTEQFFEKGLGALKDRKLFGLKIEVDSLTEGEISCQ